MKHWPLTIIASLIAITPALAQEKIAFTSTRSGTADIFSMSPDGTGQTNLTNTSNVVEEFPSFNADGSKIAYNRTDAVWTMNANGSSQTLVKSGSLPVHATFRPGSSLLYYSRFGGPDHDIYSIQVNGTGETRLVNNYLGDYYVRFAPNGSKFTYYSFDAGSQPNIYFANPDGTGQTKMTTSNNNTYASWHPDGGQIVFQSSRDGNDEIYVMNVYGTIQTRITNNAFSDSRPVFSPDGTKIAFVSNRDGNNEIYVMNADGTGQTRLTNSPGDDNSPTWTQTLAANAPSAQINDITVAEGNTGTGSATFTITLSQASATPVKISYRTYDGTAHAGSDYTAVPLTTVTFAAGETSKTISVPLLTDTRDEPNENFSVRIAAVGATISKQQGLATINDDDATPSLTINDLTLTEGSTGVYNANITVNLSAISGQTVTVQYATANGSALGGTDYTARTGTLTIPAGTASGTIQIPIIGDQTLEGDESFVVNLSNPVNATISDSQASVTLINDDVFPTVSINDVSVSEGGTATFTISLSSATGATVTVNYATSNATATAGSDYVATNGTATIAAGQTSTTVTVSTLNDTEIENSETFVVNLGQAANAYLGKSQGVATVLSEDIPQISISNVTLREGNSGLRNLYFTIALSDPAPFPVSVSYSTADGTALAGSDYITTSGTVIFAPGQTSQPFIVPIIGDTVVENDETFIVNTSAIVNLIPLNSIGQGLIFNDDEEPISGSSSKASTTPSAPKL